MQMIIKYDRMKTGRKKKSYWGMHTEYDLKNLITESEAENWWKIEDW